MPALAVQPDVIAAYAAGGLAVLAAFVSGALALARVRSNGAGTRPPRSVADTPSGAATVGDWQMWITKIVVEATQTTIAAQLGPFLLEVRRHNKAMERRLSAQNRILMKLLAKREEERG